jgi:hypothetical protein
MSLLALGLIHTMAWKPKEGPLNDLEIAEKEAEKIASYIEVDRYLQ